MKFKTALTLVRNLQLGHSGFVVSNESRADIDDVVQHRFRQAGINTEPKRVSHREIRILEITHNSELHSLIGRLSRQVATEEQPSSHSLTFQCLD